MRFLFILSLLVTHNASAQLFAGAGVSFALSEATGYNAAAHPSFEIPLGAIINKPSFAFGPVVTMQFFKFSNEIQYTASNQSYKATARVNRTAITPTIYFAPIAGNYATAGIMAGAQVSIKETVVVSSTQSGSKPETTTRTFADAYPALYVASTLDLMPDRSVSLMFLPRAGVVFYNSKPTVEIAVSLCVHDRSKKAVEAD